MSSVERAKQQKDSYQEMQDLQTQHGKKKKKLIDQQNEEIEGLKKNYRAQKSSIIESEEAAINHIQSKERERHANLSQDRAKAQSDAEAQLKKLEDHYKTKLTSLQNHRTEQAKEISEMTQAELQKQRSAYDTKSTQAREENKQAFNNMRAEYQTAIKSETTKRENSLTDAQTQTQTQLQNEKQKAERAYGKAQERYEKELQTQTATGESRVSEAKDKNARQLALVDGEGRKTVESKRTEWQHKEKFQDSIYQGKLQHAKQGYDRELQRQNKHFVSRSKASERDHKIALDSQNRTQQKQLVVAQQDFVVANQKYSGREEDPFYKTYDHGSKLSEDQEHYYLRTFLPAHEKDNVKVIIKQDKAVVSGRRGFADKINDDDKRIETSNFQTFKEVFPFSEPVITKGMVREREGDYITFRIPKFTKIPSGGTGLG